MATHSSTLTWRIPWREEPGRLQSMGLQRVRHDWATSFSLFRCATDCNYYSHNSYIGWCNIIVTIGWWWNHQPWGGCRGWLTRELSRELLVGNGLCRALAGLKVGRSGPLLLALLAWCLPGWHHYLCFSFWRSKQVYWSSLGNLKWDKGWHLEMIGHTFVIILGFFFS